MSLLRFLALLGCCSLPQLVSAFVVNSKTAFTPVTTTTTKGTHQDNHVCPCAATKSFLLVGTRATIARANENMMACRSSSNRSHKIALFSQTSAKTETEVTHVVLETLEKRLKKGSLTDEETITAIEASDLLLDRLDELDEGGAPQQMEQDSNVHQQQEQQQQQQQHIYDEHDLRTAVAQMDTNAISQMIQSGLEMDETTTNEAFWAVVQAVDLAEAQDRPLPANVTQMLHHIFDADRKHLLLREKHTTNVTCMQPDDSQGLEGAARKMNYIFDDGDHKNLPLMPGRKCEGGNCCDKCSRNIFPTFASDAECDLETFSELSAFTFNNLETVSAGTILQFVRLIERVRRTIAYEYGLPLKTILPLQAYSRKYVAGMTQKGGGGGEGDFVTLHTDEATHSGYHYSCVLYLSTQGEDFEGGNFVFNDPVPKSSQEEEEGSKDVNYQEYSDEIDEDLLELLKRGELPDEIIFNEDMEDKQDDEAAATSLDSLEDEIRRAGRVLTPFHPTRGSAVIFSSGWENMHEVEKITSGVRYAVPCFFTTCPVPDAAYEQMHVGKPKTDEDIADDWLHLLLAHRKEEPMESVGRVKELLMKWHYMCTPLSEH